MVQMQDELQRALCAATRACRDAIKAFPVDGSYSEEAVNEYLDAARQQQLIQMKMRESK